MTKQTHKEVELKNHLESLLSNTKLRTQEEQLLRAALNSVGEGDYYNRVVFDLKNGLSSLILQGNASEPVIKFMAELSRIEPSSGPSSIWNGLIKR
jgi:predicted S18 family serine protease